MMDMLRRMRRHRSLAVVLLAAVVGIVAVVGSGGGLALGSANGGGPAEASRGHGKKHKKRGRRGPRGPRGTQGPPGPAGPQGPPGKGTAFLFRKNGTFPTETIVSAAGVSFDASCTAGVLKVEARATEDHSIIHLTRFEGAAVANVNDNDFTQSDSHIDLGVNNQGLVDYVSPGGQVVQVTYLTVSTGKKDNCVFAGYYSIG